MKVYSTIYYQILQIVLWFRDDNKEFWRLIRPLSPPSIPPSNI